MSDNAHSSGHTFSCRIDGRAGYLHVFDDRLELARSGRGAPQVVPLHLVTAVTTGKVCRMLTAVELVAAGVYLELKLPSIDAPRVAELIAVLAEDAPIPVPEPIFVAPEPMPVAVPVIPVQVFEPVEIVEPALMEAVPYEPVVFDPAPEDSVMAGFVMPDFSMKVEMPEWTPLESDESAPDAAAVDLAAIVAQRDYVVAEVEMPQWTPLPETDLDELVPELAIEELNPGAAGSVLAAAAVAALAELENMLNEVPSAVVAELPDEPSIPAQLHSPVDVPEVEVELSQDELSQDELELPQDELVLPPDLLRRLHRLEVLRNSGIMTEADFAAAEAELYETALSEPQTA